MIILDLISIFILGGLVFVVPLVIWYLRKQFLESVEKCKLVEDSLKTTLIELNKLHNDGVKAHRDLDGRVQKLETALAAQQLTQKIGRGVIT